MSAALTRYANPAAAIGHAGPCAPIHSDERIAIADLPRFADPQPVNLQGFRAHLLQGEVKSLRKQHRIMLDALREIALGDDDAGRLARQAMLRASFE